MTACRPLILALLAALAPGAASAARAPAAPLDHPSVLLARPIDADSGWSEIAACVLPDSNGALIAGWTTRGHEPADALLLRVTREGEVTWRRRYGGARLDLAFTVTPHPGGGWMLAGFTASAGAGGTDGWIARLDARGDTLWTRTYGGPGDERLIRLHAVPGGWMAFGQAMTAGADSMQAWVLKIDDAGRETATWTWGGGGIDRGLGGLPTPDGGALVAGLTGASREAAVGFVARLGPDGRERWVHRGSNPGFQIGYHVEPWGDGTWLVIGYGSGGPARDRDGQLLRFADDGRVLWRRTIGGATYDRLDHARVFADGSLVALGYTQRPGAANDEERWDLVVHALDPRGNRTWTGRFGGDGVEFARGLAGTADDLWLVGHTTTGRAESRVLLVRLDVTAVVGREDR